jgi:hypothetical protein
LLKESCEDLRRREPHRRPADWVVARGAAGAGSGASEANRRTTFSVLRDTLFA